MLNIPTWFTNAKPYYKEKGVCELTRGRVRTCVNSSTCFQYLKMFTDERFYFNGWSMLILSIQ